jgi:hypothetical protein
LIGFNGLFGVFFVKSKDDICSASSKEPAVRQFPYSYFSQTQA